MSSGMDNLYADLIKQIVHLFHLSFIIFLICPLLLSSYSKINIIVLLKLKKKQHKNKHKQTHIYEIRTP